MHKPDLKRAEETALGLLREFGYTEPPINPKLLAYGLEIKVTFAIFSGDQDRVSGYFDADDNEIVVNQEEYPQRQTFTIAHELGHKLLHKDWARSTEYKVMWRNAAESQEPHEREADVFAANLLMPKFLLDEYLDRAPQQLARLFAVSLPAMRARLSHLYGV